MNEQDKLMDEMDYYRDELNSPDMSESNLYAGYSFYFDWSKEDDEWAARCIEYPLLSYLDENKNKAMAGLLRIVAEELEE